MKILSPAGYAEITPLQKDHRILLPRGGQIPVSFQRLHAIPLSLSEFGPASRDYPIVFAKGEGDDEFRAVAVLGMQAGQNLFILGDGLWDRRTYLPGYVRRYPFCMADVAIGGEFRTEHVVCVEASALSEEGEALYAGNGDPLAHWTVLEKLILDYESDLQRGNRLCRLLGELDVLEPFTMKAEVDGFTLQLDGMHRVAQDRLEALPQGELQRIFEMRGMDKLYAHLLSLDNFRRMLNRRSFFAIQPPADARGLN